VGLVWIAAKRSKMPQPLPLKAVIFAALGLFAYHALYFSALKSAPAAEASLIAYLWPLFIVLGSAFLPGERLRWYHAAGALLGMIGCALLVTGGRLDSFEGAHFTGYALALCAAFTWAGYSLLSRAFADVPTQLVTVSCAIAAILSAIASLWLEPVAWALSPLQWASLVGLGLLPLGGAFYVWDYAVKFGDIQWIGTASYAAPLISTLILVAVGIADPAPGLFVACALIVGGALLASGRLAKKAQDPA
ncbi:MAG: DMT family transporter, partial [Pseudomonadota bacterium]